MIMVCKLCRQDIRPDDPHVEETGGDLGPGHAHGSCFWRNVARVRLDREEILRDRVEELEELLRERSKPWWKRKLDAALARRFPT